MDVPSDAHGVDIVSPASHVSEPSLSILPLIPQPMVESHDLVQQPCSGLDDQEGILADLLEDTPMFHDEDCFIEMTSRTRSS